MTKDYVFVTTISQFRHRYVMHKDDLQKLNGDIHATDDDLSEWAMDTVTMEQCEEFSQVHLGETIIDNYDCDEDEMLSFFDIDNDYLKEWTQEYKIEWVRKNLERGMNRK